MKNRLAITLIAMVIILTACTRPASVRPDALIPPDAAENTAIAPNNGQGLISATQTAKALTSATKTADPATAAAGTPAAEATPVDIVMEVTATGDTSNIPIPTLARPYKYELRDGENPWCIARRFNVDIGELLSVNMLTTTSQPQPGTLLRIPDTGHPWSSGERALAPHPAMFTVRSGDTLSGIACLFGDVSPEAIITVNRLVEPYTLEPGTVLSIP